MSHDRGSVKFTLVGGGIASLAAAAFLIRDGDIAGSAITILDEQAVAGGALDAGGSAASGYHMRGGRMFESKYLCTLALFAGIPTLDGNSSVSQEIIDWNARLRTSSKSRLMRDGKRQTAPDFGLSEKQIMMLGWLAVEPEILLSDSRIQDHFEADFFTTNFWLMWCTTFAFQPWHSAIEFKRYLLRFAHMVEGFNRLEGIWRTRYNQYESMVLPLRNWLQERGVRIIEGVTVTDVRLADHRATAVALVQDGDYRDIVVGEHDFVLVTLGSMTEGAHFGTMDNAATLGDRSDGAAWTLWRNLASERPEFGHPEAFCDHIDQSKWLSFTATLKDPTLLRLIQDKTGNVPGEGGLITFPQSSWLASIVVPYQPHFREQPDDVGVLWGYGLSVDQPGDFTHKAMSDCNGREILTEILGHLHIEAEATQILATSICIPCMMPFITSQFLPRRPGDRPPIIPKGWKNIALIGQFVEQPDDVVFTVEYSIRAAQNAVVALLDLDCPPPPVYQGKYDARVLYRSIKALHDLTV